MITWSFFSSYTLINLFFISWTDSIFRVSQSDCATDSSMNAYSVTSMSILLWWEFCLSTHNLSTQMSRRISHSLSKIWNNQVFCLRSVFNEDYSFFEFSASFFTFISATLDFRNFEQSLLRCSDSSQLKHFFAFMSSSLVESRLDVLMIIREVNIQNWLEFQIVVLAEMCFAFSLVEIEILMMLTVLLMVASSQSLQ